MGWAGLFELLPFRFLAGLLSFDIHERQSARVRLEQFTSLPLFLHVQLRELFCVHLPRVFAWCFALQSCMLSEAWRMHAVGCMLMDAWVHAVGCMDACGLLAAN